MFGSSDMRASTASDIRLLAAAGGAGFLERLLNRFTGFPGALLNPANKLFLLAFGILEIVIRELGPLLFQLSRGEQTRTDIVVSKPGMKSHGEPDSIGDLIRRRHPRRLFVVAGEGRRRALNLQFPSPPVATRNGLPPPARIGAPEINAPIGTIRASVRREGAFPSPRTPTMQRKCENRSKPRSFLVC